ncbi:MAG TPA: FecR domain-containing protein [Puia sp.]|nr:FecR domain-containing protein [Puia sp.]
MENEKIIALIEGYGAGTLTPEEEVAFFQWYSVTSLEKFHELLSQCKRLPDHLSYYPDMPADFRARLEQDIRDFDPAGQRPIGRPAAGQPDSIQQPDNLHKIPFLRQPRWWAAAAAIILFLGAGSYFLFFNQSHKQITQQQPLGDDVAPGKTKAILTLSDGTKITLDSTQTGQLAVQGKTTVVNHNGTITYSGKATPGPLYNTLTTGRGEQSPSLTLSDGTRVWLNAASSIRYPVAFTGDARNVEVTGEAYFEVAKDKAKPFYVKVRDIEVAVLGTHFNINAYQDEPNIKTTLLEGSVKILLGQPTQQQQGRVLSPGQQSEVEGGINHVKEADVDQVMAWKNGLFNFNHADLPTVLRQLARWYDIDVKFEGNGPSRSFHGKITRDLNLSQVINVLQELDVKFRIEGKTLIVKQ